MAMAVVEVGRVRVVVRERRVAVWVRVGLGDVHSEWVLVLVMLVVNVGVVVLERRVGVQRRRDDQPSRPR